MHVATGVVVTGKEDVLWTNDVVCSVDDDAEHEHFGITPHELMSTATICTCVDWSPGGSGITMSG